VPPAALDHGLATEHRPMALSACLAAVDDEQDPLLGVEAPSGEVGDQAGAHPRRSRWCPRPPQRHLGAVGGDPERADQAVPAHVEAVEEYHQPALVAERAGAQLGQPLRGRGDESP
jgi:hypothetical protein